MALAVLDLRGRHLAPACGVLAPLNTLPPCATGGSFPNTFRHDCWQLYRKKAALTSVVEIVQKGFPQEMKQGDPWRALG